MLEILVKFIGFLAIKSTLLISEDLRISLAVGMTGSRYYSVVRVFSSFMHRAPSPTKRKERSEDKTKERGKEKSGAKEGGEKDRGRDKTRKRRSASTGSSSSRLGDVHTHLKRRPFLTLPRFCLCLQGRSSVR